MKKILFFLLVMVMLQVNSSQAVANASRNFTDLTREHWAYNTVNTMVGQGYILGYEDGSFKPEKKMTREEFAVLLVRCLDIIPEEIEGSFFVDISSKHWSINYVEAVKEYLPGYPEKGGQWVFKGSEQVTRQDVTAALVRAKKIAVSNEPNTELLQEKFKDYKKIDSALQPYVVAAVEKQLISGFLDQTFRPEEALTRAQAATLLYRTFFKTNSAIKNLLTVGDVATLDTTDQQYSQLAYRLNNEFPFSVIQGSSYKFKFNVKNVAQNIEGYNNLIYVFANSDAPFSFELANKRYPEMVEEYIEGIKELVLNVYPDRPLLIMAGYTKQDDKYWWMQSHSLFEGTDFKVVKNEDTGVYRVDKFFSGALFVKGELIERF